MFLLITRVLQSNSVLIHCKKAKGFRMQTSKNEISKEYSYDLDKGVLSFKSLKLDEVKFNFVASIIEKHPDTKMLLFGSLDNLKPFLKKLITLIDRLEKLEALDIEFLLVSEDFQVVLEFMQKKLSLLYILVYNPSHIKTEFYLYFGVSFTSIILLSLASFTPIGLLFTLGGTIFLHDAYVLRSNLSKSDKLLAFQKNLIIYMERNKFFQELKSCDFTNLQSLQLEKKLIDHSVLQELVSSLKQVQHLTDISFRHNKINDKGAKILAELLLVNTLITSLDLSINLITSDGSKDLIDACAKNSNFKMLNLSYNYLRNADNLCHKWLKNYSFFKSQWSSVKIESIIAPDTFVENEISQIYLLRDTRVDKDPWHVLLLIESIDNQGQVYLFKADFRPNPPSEKGMVTTQFFDPNIVRRDVLCDYYTFVHWKNISNTNRFGIRR